MLLAGNIGSLASIVFVPLPSCNIPLKSPSYFTLCIFNTSGNSNFKFAFVADILPSFFTFIVNVKLSSSFICLFRIVFDDIKKERDSVVEVTWTISVISIDSQNEPYEEYSKADLREGLNAIFERTGQLYDPYNQILDELDDCIYECMRSDSTEESIKNAVDTTTGILNKMADWKPQGIPDDVEKRIDDVNGGPIE